MFFCAVSVSVFVHRLTSLIVCFVLKLWGTWGFVKTSTFAILLLLKFSWSLWLMGVKSGNFLCCAVYVSLKYLDTADQRYESIWTFASRTPSHLKDWHPYHLIQAFLTDRKWAVTLKISSPGSWERKGTSKGTSSPRTVHFQIGADVHLAGDVFRTYSAGAALQ